MSKLFKLFKPSDFVNCSHAPMEQSFEEAASVQANTLLRKWLDASPTVYGDCGYPTDGPIRGWQPFPQEDDTHKAKVVAIEEFNPKEE